MIFHKSLSKKKGAAYSYFSGLSAGIVPALLLTVVETFLMAALPLLEFISIDYFDSDSINRVLAKDKYKFFVFAIDDESTLFIIFALLGILAIFAAIRLFSFICDKRTVNVFYSLGIKRRTLFLTKYLAGATLLTAGTVISTILSYIVNLIFLGASWQLSLVLLHIYCGLSVFVLICFSAAAVVFSSVGTVSEAVVYSVALLFAPTVITFITELYIDAFLDSSTLGMLIFAFDNTTHDTLAMTESLLFETANFNPLLFFVNEIMTYSTGFLNGGEVQIIIDEEKASWIFPNLFLHFPWFVIALAAGILGAFLFKHIKAENCGFLNTNKILSNLTIFELCLIGSSVFIGEIQWTEKYIVIGAGVAVAFALYLLAEIFLKRSFIKILKSLYKFVAHMAVIAIIITVCSTGAFGYSSYIPNKNKIESVEISVPLSYSLISSKVLGTDWMTNDFIMAYEKFRHQLMPKMTDSDSIDKVMEINRKANETDKDEGLRCEIVICYNLKNGKTSSRCHVLTSREEITEIFGLFETKEYKEEIKNFLINPLTVEDAKKELAEYGWINEGTYSRLALNYEFSEVTAVSSSLYENKVLNLTKEQFDTLKNAVYSDLCSMSAENYYFSDKKQLGVLSFNTQTEKLDDLFYGDGTTDETDDVYSDEDVTMTSPPDYIIEGDFFGDEVYEDKPYDGFLPETEEPVDSRYREAYTYPFESLGNFRSYGNYNVVITEDMVNTLNALNTMGLGDCFDSTYTVESVSFRECNVTDIFKFYTDIETNYIHDFFAYPVTPENMYFDENESIDAWAENKITDKEKINELQGIMKLHEYTFDDGYYCLIKYTNGTYTAKFMSREDAPAYVTNYNYTVSYNYMY